MRASISQMGDNTRLRKALVLATRALDADLANIQLAAALQAAIDAAAHCQDAETQNCIAEAEELLKAHRMMLSEGDSASEDEDGTSGEVRENVRGILQAAMQALDSDILSVPAFDRLQDAIDL